jgi:hypothetical protein
MILVRPAPELQNYYRTAHLSMKRKGGWRSVLFPRRLARFFTRRAFRRTGVASSSVAAIGFSTIT